MAFVNVNFGGSSPLDAMDEVALQAIHLERDYRKEIEHFKSLSIQIKNVDRELDQLKNDSAASRKKKMELPPRIEVIFSNVGSVSQSLLNVKEHVANLRKTLELDKIKTNEDMKRYAATLAHYKSLWDSYDAIYERRPIAIKRKEMKTLIKIENVVLANTKFKCKEITEKIKQFTAVKEKQGTVRIIQLAKNFKERINIFRQKADLYRMIQKLEGDIKEMTREKELLFNMPVVSLVVVPARMEIEPQVTPVPVVAPAPVAKTPRSDPLMFPSFELPKLQLPRIASSPPKSRCFRDLRDQRTYESSQRGGYNTTDARNYRDEANGIRRALAAGFSPSISGYSATHLATSTPLHGLGQESMEMGNVSTIVMPIEMGSEVAMEADLYPGECGEQYSSSSIMIDSSEYDRTPVEYHQGGEAMYAQGTPSLPRKSARRHEQDGDGLAVVDVSARRASWSRGNSFQQTNQHAVLMDSGVGVEPTSQQLMDQGTPRRQQRNIAQEQKLAQRSQSFDQGMSRSQQHNIAQEQELAQRSQSFNQGMSRSQHNIAQEQELAQRSQSFNQGMSRSQQHNIAQEQELAQHSQSFDQGMSRSQQHDISQELAQHSQLFDQGMSRSQQHDIAQEHELAQHSQSFDQGMPRSQQRNLVQEQMLAQHNKSSRSQQQMLQEQPVLREHVIKPNFVHQQIAEAHESMLTSHQSTLQGADIQSDAGEMNYSTSETNEPTSQPSVSQGRKEPVPQHQAMDTESTAHTVHSQQRDADQSRDITSEGSQMGATPLSLGKVPSTQGGAVHQAKDTLLEMAQTEDPALAFQITSSQGDGNRENVEPHSQISEPEQEEFPSQTVANLSQTSQSQSMDEILDVKKRREFLKQLMQSPEFNYLPRQPRAVQSKEQDVCQDDDDTAQTYFVNSFMNFRNNDASLNQVDGIETQTHYEIHRGDGDGVSIHQGNEERETNSRANFGGGDTSALQPMNTGVSADHRYDEYGTSTQSIPPARVMSRIQAPVESHVVDENPTETIEGNLGQMSFMHQEEAVASHGKNVGGYTRGHAPENVDRYPRSGPPEETPDGYTRGCAPERIPDGYHQGHAPDDIPVGYHQDHAPENADGYPRGHARDESPDRYSHGPEGTPDYEFTGDVQSPYFGGRPGPDCDSWLGGPVPQEGRAVSESGGWKSPIVVASPDTSAAGANPFGKQTATPQDSAGMFSFGSNSRQPPQSTFFGSSDPPAAGNIDNRQPPNRSEVFTFNFDNKSNKPSIFKLF